MGRILLICRLAVRVLRHRPASAALMLLAIATAATTLTLGLALHGTTSRPYDTTRAATAGPDVMAQVIPPGPRANPPADVGALAQLTHASGVDGHSGPYPFTFAALRAGGHLARALVEGRDQVTASVDQPDLTQGSWIRPGAAVIERAFADALGVRAGDGITLNGRSFLISGIAVTAVPGDLRRLWPVDRGTEPDSARPYLAAPSRCTKSGHLSRAIELRGEPQAGRSGGRQRVRERVRVHAPRHERSVPHLVADHERCGRPAGIRRAAGADDRQLATGSAGRRKRGRTGRRTDGGTDSPGRTPQGRRRHVGPGRRHSAGRTPDARPGGGRNWPASGMAVCAAAHQSRAAAGRRPRCAARHAGHDRPCGGRGAGGSRGRDVRPAVRAAWTSTVRALADSARAPRRRAWLVVISSWLPVPLLLGLRFAARRPRRMVLCVATIAITAAGIVAVLMVHARSDQSLGAASGLDNPQNDRLNQELMVISVALFVQAAVNAVLITWATVLDARHSAALAPALGETPQQVTIRLSSAEVLPALVGALLGIPGGIGLVSAVRHGGTLYLPPVWWLIVTVLATVTAVAAITMIPAWLGTRHPAAAVLQSEPV